MASNIKSWKAGALDHLAELGNFSLYPVHTAPMSSQLLGAALNIKPDTVGKLKDYTVTFTVENRRAELRINNWPNFQRALVSLISPRVLKDFSL